MSYTLPFTQGMKVVEFAGGDQPVFRPNIDVRPGPMVDLVLDFSRAIFPALAPAQADGVFMRYGLEHLSWRRVRSFLAEIAILLKPGGVAVFIVPDTRAQMRYLLEKPVWTDQDAGTLMGDQNYAGPQAQGDNSWIFNAHHAIFDHDYAKRLCLEAGFISCETHQLPELTGHENQSPLDMIIEARTSKAVIFHGQN